MFTLLSIIHVIVCFILILVVLLQTGKGADIAAAFGGSSQTAFGARGATTFMAKVTTGAAVIFMLTSMTLALVSSSPSISVLEEEPAASEAATPAAPDAQQPEGALPAAPAGGAGDEMGVPPGDGGEGESPADPNDSATNDGGPPSP